MIVLTVYLSGGEYTPDHVRALYEQVRLNAPNRCLFGVLTDDWESIQDYADFSIPLLHGWPKWWSKIELFRLGGTFLYLDLDTVILGDLTPFWNVIGRHSLTGVSDFYKPERFQSCFMGWHGDLSYIYDRFKTNASAYMNAYRSDQEFIENTTKGAETDVGFWQKELPDTICSYKVPSCVPEILCFHGKPRPWDTEEWVSLYHCDKA